METISTFDLVSTLNVISNDAVLSEMFKTKFSLKKNDSLESIVKLGKDGKLDTNKIQYAKGVYENLIIGDTKYMEKYRGFISGTHIPSTISINKKAVVNATEPAKVKPTTIVKKPRVKTLPKEYNKKRILEDIASKGGKADEFEKAMMALNDMKNIRSRLNAMGKRHRYKNTGEMTDENCRLIIAAVRLLKNTMAKIKK